MPQVVPGALYVLRPGLEQPRVGFQCLELLRQEFVRMPLVLYLRRALPGVQRILVQGNAPEKQDETQQDIRPRIHQRPVDQQDQRRGAKSNRHDCEAPACQSAA